jgi:hypothetical protein
MTAYRESDLPAETKPSIEEGLRDVLTALKPFDSDDTTRILLAAAALYDLPLVEDDRDDDSAGEDS